MNKVQEKKEKKLLFKKNSDIRTVIIIGIGFIVAVCIVQLIQGFISEGTLIFPTLISPMNLLNILMANSAVGIMAMGMTMVMLAGGIDLSVGMMTSMVCIFTARGVMMWGMSLPLTLVCAILLPIVIETLMGLIISRLNVEAFIITLGGMITCQGLALLFCKSQETPMDQNLAFLKTNLIEGAQTSDGLNLVFPIYVVVFIVIGVATWAMLKYSKFGRRIYAVGANPQAAYLSGINVKNIRLATYMINGFLVGVGAIMLLCRVNSAIINIGQNKEIDVIAAVVIGGVAMSGGKGNAMGSFMGAILMGIIANSLNIMKLQSEWQYLAKGLILIIAVAGGAFSAKLAEKRAIREMEQKAALAADAAAQGAQQ